VLSVLQERTRPFVDDDQYTRSATNAGTLSTATPPGEHGASWDTIPTIPKLNDLAVRRLR
jgi:hypothetical protein